MTAIFTEIEKFFIGIQFQGFSLNINSSVCADVLQMENGSYVLADLELILWDANVYNDLGNCVGGLDMFTTEQFTELRDMMFNAYIKGNKEVFADLVDEAIHQ